MEARGIIFTALDTDHDNIESWNRWYDLEHLPPNIAMPEIAGGARLGMRSRLSRCHAAARSARSPSTPLGTPRALHSR